MTDYEIDPLVWFADREVVYPPPHFIRTHTLLTAESKQWVLNNLRGRYSIINNFNDFLSLSSIGSIAFEDPSEATIYELRWS